MGDYDFDGRKSIKLSRNPLRIHHQTISLLHSSKHYLQTQSSDLVSVAPHSTTSQRQILNQSSTSFFHSISISIIPPITASKMRFSTAILLFASTLSVATASWNMVCEPTAQDCLHQMGGYSCDGAGKKIYSTIAHERQLHSWCDDYCRCKRDGDTDGSASSDSGRSDSSKSSKNSKSSKASAGSSHSSHRHHRRNAFVAKRFAGRHLHNVEY